jgi:hypothetical protein
MADNQHVEKSGNDHAAEDDDIAAILAEGEAGVGTAMRAVEAVEAAYYSAVDATTTRPSVGTTNTAW